MTSLRNPHPAYRGRYAPPPGHLKSRNQHREPIIRRTGANVLTDVGRTQRIPPKRQQPQPQRRLRPTLRQRNRNKRTTLSPAHPTNHLRISSRLDKHAGHSDPFGSSKGKSPFAAAYSDRRFPCILEHGSIKHTLKWNRDPSTLDYGDILVLFSEGILESKHPYHFVGRVGFRDLLAAEGSEDKVLPFLHKITANIRLALTKRDPDVFDAGCNALNQLSGCVGPNLDQFLHQLIPPLGKRIFDQRHTDLITEVFHTLCLNGSDRVIKLIKKKVPTFIPMLS